MTSRRPARGGRGSNQYQTKPAAPPVERAAEHSSDEVAWAFHPDRDGWATQGLVTWAEVRPWAEAGIDPFESAAWRGREFTAPQAVQWKAVLPHGPFALASPARTAADWRDEGLTPDEVAAWVEAGVTQVQVARPWLEAGIAAEVAGRWKNCDFQAPYAALAIKAGSTPVEEAKAWTTAGVTKDRWRWTALGIELDEVQAWVDRFDDFMEANQWRRAGVTVDEAGRWRDAGVKSPYERDLWIEAGVPDPATVARWLAAGRPFDFDRDALWDPRIAIQWMQDHPDALG